MFDVLNAPAGGGGLWLRGGPFNPRRRGITLPSWLTGPLMASGPLPDYAWDAGTGFWLAFRRAYPSARAWIDGVGGNYVAPRTKSTFSKTGVLFDTPEHVPAIDFSQGVGGIRTDVMRTNLVTTPLTCDGAGWSVYVAGTTTGASPALSPDGVTPFQRTIEGSASGSGGKRFSFNVTAGVPHTVAGYFKAAGRFSVMLLAVGAGAPDSPASVQFNLLTGEFQLGAGGMSRTGRIEPVLGMPGVYRLIMTWTPTVSGAAYFDWRVSEVYPAASNVGTPYQHVPGTPQVDFWGINLEANAPYASPLIKLGNTTRAAENPIILPWVHQSEHTLVCDATTVAGNDSTYRNAMNADDGTGNNRTQLRHQGMSMQASIVAGNVAQLNTPAGAWAANERKQIAHVVKAGAMAAFMNGVKTASSAGSALPNITRLEIGGGVGPQVPGSWEGWLFKGAAWRSPLTDAQMIEVQQRMAA